MGCVRLLNTASRSPVWVRLLGRSVRSPEGEAPPVLDCRRNLLDQVFLDQGITQQRKLHPLQPQRVSMYDLQLVELVADRIAILGTDVQINLPIRIRLSSLLDLLCASGSALASHLVTVKDITQNTTNFIG